jgi:hypothetical protein
VTLAPEDRTGGLLAWQWRNYPDAHRLRATLVVHLITQPLFVLGLFSLLGGLATLAWHPAVGGLVAMLLAFAAQGRMHGKEPGAPLPFRGPGDVVARIFVEQLVTFPRFVLTGGLARAWRDAAR